MCEFYFLVGGGAINEFHGMLLQLDDVLWDNVL